MSVRRVYAVPLLAVLIASGCGGGSPVGGPAKATLTGATSSTTSAAGATSTTTSSNSTTSTTAPTTPTTPGSRMTTALTPHTAATQPGPPAAGRLAPVPRAGAEPAVRFPRNEPAVGSGANASVTPVPDALWNRMVGYSWTPGCPVGRSQLRYVRVNFWGFDGVRSRGGVVVNATIAGATASAFTRLYALQFRIRQMKPMDSGWGRNPKGPGANDYAAMNADNTSAFNCRYVGGQEASRVYSKHAYGTAIDVNDFENPYVADNGTVYPDTFFLRRTTAPGVFTGGGSAVGAFTSQGLRWGGLWSHPDYQHFER